MSNDVSNTTIAILLVLTILVSIVGTWTVLDAAKQVKPVPMTVGAQVASGQVQLEIAGEAPSDVTTGGKMSIMILK